MKVHVQHIYSVKHAQGLLAAVWNSCIKTKKLPTTNKETKKITNL